jgi:hypothetical protein
MPCRLATADIRSRSASRMIATTHGGEGRARGRSAARLSPHPHLSWARRLSHEPRSSAPAVADAGARGAAEAAEEAGCRGSAVTRRRRVA